MITQRENVNLVPEGIAERVHVSQFDTGSRTLAFDLFAYEEISISGISANIEGLKPDGNYFSYSCTVSGSVVTLPIEQQMTACAGEVICTLKLYRNEDDVLRTINFILDVEEKPMPTDAVVSETEIPAIVELGRQYAKKSEAYAVGKVDGVDVPTTHEAYHNNAKYYSAQAGTSASNAHTSEVNAKTSEDNAKDSEDNAKASELASAASEANASNSATASSNSATASSNSATLSESYAKGGTNTRTGEDTDNSKYYKERCEQILADMGYPINPKGPINFVQLPTSGMRYGWLYQINDAFTTDNRFVEGAGVYCNEYTEVYWTSQDKWAIMQGAGVTGVKGSAEQNYRKGQVNITPQNLGIDDLDDIDTPEFTQSPTRTNINSGENISTILGKIKKFFTDLKSVAFTGNASDVSFDSTGTSSSATDVQTALTEALSATVPTASDIEYSNTSSGLSAINVQDAIDEINSNLSDLMVYNVPITSNTRMNSYETAGYVSGIISTSLAHNYVPYIVAENSTTGYKTVMPFVDISSTRCRFGNVQTETSDTLAIFDSSAPSFIFRNIRTAGENVQTLSDYTIKLYARK